MTAARQHESLVTDQFGPRAAAYVTSAVHAQGEDLGLIAEVARDTGVKTVLDLGCGGGHVSFAVAPHVQAVTAYDLSEDMLAAVAAEAQRRGLANVATRQGSAERLPFDDASFCMVASRYSAHHWGDIPAGLREARRVAKPRGRAVFADVVAPQDPLLDTFLQTIELLRDPSHVRNQSVGAWCAMAEAAGFRVDSVRTGRLRLDFAAWIARIATPPVHAEAIRSLQARMSEPVQRHFAIEADGTFTLDTMVLVATAA
ncbi:class I SAM-dependent methyltransferase [Labrys wisconsinensis]|uniref:SAM-dependent methyltransferase n=1 Tax=Labrys wisconsinensis TaxID=425677 RepID=A0ABU0J1M3_9HYPH|nr:methyltransferase domain-containing protein [Labrys wisconsinensis]MDQ0468139.1 SAM-dependent methyltransferase [Labrys wisconsinensis]